MKDNQSMKIFKEKKRTHPNLKHAELNLKLTLNVGKLEGNLV